MSASVRRSKVREVAKSDDADCYPKQADSFWNDALSRMFNWSK